LMRFSAFHLTRCPGFWSSTGSLVTRRMTK